MKFTNFNGRYKMHPETSQIPERFQRKPLILRVYEVIFGVIALGSIIICGFHILSVSKIESMPVIIALGNLPMLLFSYQLALEQKSYSSTFVIALSVYVVLAFSFLGVAVGLCATVFLSTIGISVFKLKRCQKYNQWLVEING